MNKVKNILLVVYLFFLFTAGSVYVSAEFFDADMAVLVATESKINYIVQMVMILLTLGQIPLALRLLKTENIHRELVREPMMLLKWGIVRIMLLGAPLVINTLLYYFFGFEPAFGYLAVITLLSMVFILPTTNRCVAETTDEPTEDSEQKREAFNEEEQA